MIRFRAAFLAVLLAVVPRGSVAHAAPFANDQRAFVLLQHPEAAFASRFAKAIHASGGHASVILPSGAAIVYASDATLASLKRDHWIERSYRARVGAADISPLDAPRARAARVWNAALEQQFFEFKNPTGFTPVPDAKVVPVPLGGTDGGPGPDAAARASALTSSSLPLGADFYDTSLFMAGTVAVGVWLLESTGSDYDWSTEEEDQSIAGVAAGMDNWVRKGGPGAFLTFFLDVRTRVLVSAEPIEHPHSEEPLWIGEALSNAGYPDPNAFEADYAYNNSIRSAFQTNWCFSIFIADSDPSVNQGLFPDGSYAWAFIGGPWVSMSRYCTWAYNYPAYFAAVPMHETGHIFWTTDEYNTYQEYSGYLHASDNFNFPACIMNQNDSTRVCQETRDQLGWRDLDGDGIIEPLDTPPIASLVPFGTEPSTSPILTGSGSALVTTIPNQVEFSRYSPPHDVSIATIDRVEVRVDEGPWFPAAALDGAFDGYEEPFTWTTPPLADGLRIVEVRAHTSVGVYTDPPARDSIWVLAQGTDRHPLVVAPAAALAVEHQPFGLSVTAYDLDGDPVQSLTASLTGLPPGNDATFTEAPDHASGVLRWTPTYADAGSYVVSFTASNVLSGTTRTRITVQNVDQAPGIAAPATVAALENQKISFTVAASDPDGDPLQSLVADLVKLPIFADATFEATAPWTTGTFSWTPTFEDAGDYDISFEATNVLVGRAETRIHVSNVDRPPVITAPPRMSGLPKALLTFNVEAADPDPGDDLPSLTVEGLPSGATFQLGQSPNTGVFSWVPTAFQKGTYLVTITAANAISVTTQVTLVIAGPDQAPIVTAPSHISAAEGTPLTIDATVLDPEGDPILSFDAAGLPSGAAFSSDIAQGTGSIAWTPTFDQAGSYQVTLSATSAPRADPVSQVILIGSAMVTIDVANVNRAPIADPGGPYRGLASAPLELHGEGSSDPDGDALDYRWDLGDGSAATGPTPLHTYASAGMFTVALTVTDALSLQDEGTTTATIEAVLAGRAFTTGGDRTLRLSSGKPLWCVRLEPVQGNFRLQDLDLASVRLVYGDGAIQPPGVKTLVISDADRNGVDDIAVCFAKSDVRTLFSGLPGGRSNVSVRLEASLVGGGIVRADFVLEVVAGETSEALVAPNPLNPSGSLTFRTLHPGVARVRIFDASGRLVASPLDRFVGAGYHDVAIGGRAAPGGELGSGVYFYRIETADASVTGRFVIAR